MDLGEQIFSYCERGHDPGPWAEPLNALSSLAFVAVAIVVARGVNADKGARGACRPLARDENTSIALLASLTAAIGAGSFLFHMLATRWAQVLDVAPIVAFMLAYLVHTARFFLALSWPAVALVIVAMLAALGIGAGLCPQDAGGGCMNGTAGYLPALVGLATLSTLLLRRRHSAAPRLLAATVLLSLAMALRTADLMACEMTRVLGRPIGLHFLWHLFNAGVLYLLLTEAVTARRR